MFKKMLVCVAVLAIASVSYAGHKCCEAKPVCKCELEVKCCQPVVDCCRLTKRVLVSVVKCCEPSCDSCVKKCDSCTNKCDSCTCKKCKCHKVKAKRSKCCCNACASVECKPICTKIFVLRRTSFCKCVMPIPCVPSEKLNEEPVIEPKKAPELILPAPVPAPAEPTKV